MTKSALSSDIIRDICEAYQNGLTIRELADSYSVSESSISRVLRKEGIVTRRRGDYASAEEGRLVAKRTGTSCRRPKKHGEKVEVEDGDDGLNPGQDSVCQEPNLVRAVAALAVDFTQLRAKIEGIKDLIGSLETDLGSIGRLLMPEDLNG